MAELLAAETVENPSAILKVVLRMTRSTTTTVVDFTSLGGLMYFHARPVRPYLHFFPSFRRHSDPGFQSSPLSPRFWARLLLSFDRAKGSALLPSLGDSRRTVAVFFQSNLVPNT